MKLKAFSKLSILTVTLCSSMLTNADSGVSSISAGIFRPTMSSGQFFCNQDYRPSIMVTQQGDSSRPGMIFIGLASPREDQAYFWTDRGWQRYFGGLYPPIGIYRDQMPSSGKFVVPLPGDEFTNAGFEGWKLMSGYGTYTAEAESNITLRRQILNEAKPARVAAGTWHSEYDSDDRPIWAYVQKNMTDKAQYHQIAILPALSCQAQWEASHPSRGK